MTSAREREERLIARCVEAAHASFATAADAVEANVFRLAGMVSRTEYPDECKNLLAVSQRYFDAYPDALVHPEEVIRQGWLVSLPRLRDLLRVRFAQHRRDV